MQSQDAITHSVRNTKVDVPMVETAAWLRWKGPVMQLLLCIVVGDALLLSSPENLTDAAPTPTHTPHTHGVPPTSTSQIAHRPPRFDSRTQNGPDRLRLLDEFLSTRPARGHKDVAHGTQAIVRPGVISEIVCCLCVCCVALTSSRAPLLGSASSRVQDHTQMALPRQRALQGPTHPSASRGQSNRCMHSLKRDFNFFPTFPI